MVASYQFATDPDLISLPFLRNKGLTPQERFVLARTMLGVNQVGRKAARLYLEDLYGLFRAPSTVHPYQLPYPVVDSVIELAESQRLAVVRSSDTFYYFKKRNLHPPVLLRRDPILNRQARRHLVAPVKEYESIEGGQVATFLDMNPEGTRFTIRVLSLNKTRTDVNSKDFMFYDQGLPTYIAAGVEFDFEAFYIEGKYNFVFLFKNEHIAYHFRGGFLGGNLELFRTYRSIEAMKIVHTHTRAPTIVTIQDIGRHKYTITLLDLNLDEAISRVDTELSEIHGFSAAFAIEARVGGQMVTFVAIAREEQDCFLISFGANISDEIFEQVQYLVETYPTATRTNFGELFKFRLYPDYLRILEQGNGGTMTERGVGGSVNVSTTRTFHNVHPFEMAWY